MVDFKKTAFRIRTAVLSIETVRKSVQLISFVLFNAVIFGIGPWPIILPVLYTLGIYQKTVGDAFSMLQWMLYDNVFPWLPLASFFLSAILLGRALCGWVCPFGFVQDLLNYIRKEKTETSLRTHSWMVRVKYVVLLITLLISGTLGMSSTMEMEHTYKAALGVFAPAPFSALSPADTLFAILPRMLYGLQYIELDSIMTGILAIRPLLWFRLILMLGVLVLVAYIPRSWCRYLCPHGAFSAIFSRFSFLGLKRDPLRCTRTDCRNCVEVCPMKVPILDLPWKKFTDSECIYCLKCVETCKTGAIRPTFP